MPNFNLNFVMQLQEQTQWCWAAVTVSVDRFFNPASTRTQCAMANQMHGQTTCCADGSTTQCNQPFATGDALNAIGRLRSQVESAQGWATADSEVTSNRPLGCRIRWSSSGAHAVVISGVGNSTDQLVTVRDPWYGTSYIAIGTLTSSYQGSGSWVRTWFLQ